MYFDPKEVGKRIAKLRELLGEYAAPGRTP